MKNYEMQFIFWKRAPHTILLNFKEIEKYTINDVFLKSTHKSPSAEKRKSMPNFIELVLRISQNGVDKSNDAEKIFDAGISESIEDVSMKDIKISSGLDNKINQILHLSKNDAQSFSQWIPLYDNKPIYVDYLIAIKQFLFGISTVDQIYFYVGGNLQLFSIQEYETNESVFPSNFEPSYIYKLVRKNLTVS
ncbi:hypothetical protein RF11_04278 [Thelohanellus kitauei]|uniref:Uncharacterized protein n=1 Tax=Thelohanellus kitauei TaxID=669202 RepID=A0A0C2M7N4_THEKT|nr:hypothetical protein RF11_04278 [Thelohanellus kitauei]